LDSESTSFPHLSALLASLTPSSGPTTRSAARQIPEEPTEPAFTISATPIPELTIDGGMDSEMIWEQMELRGQTVDRMLGEMFGQEEDQEDDEDDMFDDDGEGEGGEEDESEDEELEGFGLNGGDDEIEGESGDGEDFESEEAEAEYYRRLGEGKEEGLDSEDPAFASDGDEEEPEAEAQGDALADEQKGLSLDNFDGEGNGKRSRPSKR
jgi:U3 small nucleolar RNA-associated protein MPP10